MSRQLRSKRPILGFTSRVRLTRDHASIAWPAFSAFASSSAFGVQVQHTSLPLPMTFVHVALSRLHLGGTEKGNNPTCPDSTGEGHRGRGTRILSSGARDLLASPPSAYPYVHHFKFVAVRPQTGESQGSAMAVRASLMRSAASSFCSQETDSDREQHAASCEISLAEPREA